MYKNYIYCLPVIFNISASIDYKIITYNVNYDNYEDKINQFESIKNDSPEYLYYYSILMKNVLFLNVISDDFDKYLVKLKDLYTELYKKNVKKYNILTTNESLSLYNYFLSRGCEYISIKKYELAKKSFNIAKEFYNTHEINVKLAFISQLLGNIDEAIKMYNEEKRIIDEENNDKRKYPKKHIKNNIKLLETINLNLLNVYLIKKDFIALLKFLINEFEKKPDNINYIEILHRLKVNHDVDITPYLSKDNKERVFQDSVLDFFDKKYPDAYKKISTIKLKKHEHLKFYSDLLYNYAADLQNFILNKNNKENVKIKNKQILDNLIKENINVCKQLLKINSRDKYIVNRLCVLYIVNKENKTAEDFIMERKINVKELHMDIFK